MRGRLMDFLVGLCTIAALIGFAAMLILFGELVQVQRYELTIQSDTAAGIREGSTAELNGVAIGIVESVKVDAGSELPVRIQVAIDQDVRIPIGTQPFAMTSLLGAGAILYLQVPFDVDDGFLPDDGQAKIEAPIRSWLLQQLNAELDGRLSPFLDSLSKVQELTDTYTELGHRLVDVVGQSNTDGATIASTIARLDALVQVAEVLAR